MGSACRVASSAGLITSSVQGMNGPTRPGPKGWPVNPELLLSPTELPARPAPRRTARRVRAWVGATLRGVARALVADSAAPEPLRYSTLLWRVWLPRGRGRSIDLIALADWLLALLVLFTVASYVETADAVLGNRFPSWVQWLVALAHAGPLVLRRRWPLAAWRCSLLALLLAGPVLRPFFPFVASAGGNLVLALCLYTVATRCDRQVAKGAYIATMGAYVVSELVNPGEFVTLSALLQVTTVYAVPLVYGHNVRVRREAVEELARQERSYEEERAARAVLQERASIARELHDVVAHCMSVIAIQAGAAPLRSPEAPPGVKEGPCGHPPHGAGGADGDAAGARDPAPGRRRRHAPARPGAHPRPGRRRGGGGPAGDRGRDRRARSRVARCQRLGLPRRAGVAEQRHAPRAGLGGRVSVGYRDSPPAIQVRVENDPPPGPRPELEDDRARHGLVGMRERVTMLRGELSAGPTRDGGFRVAATLPLQPS